MKPITTGLRSAPAAMVALIGQRGATQAARLVTARGGSDDRTRRDMRWLPPLDTLPAFGIAAERLSFSAAAEALHLTDGAVSRQIKTLGDHLGVQLLRCFNRRVELAEAGAALLPAV